MGAPLGVFAEVVEALEGQLRGKLETLLKRANRHELRMLYTDFLLRPDALAAGAAAGAAGASGAGASGGGGGGAAALGGSGGGWEGLRGLCLRKYREQVEGN